MLEEDATDFFDLKGNSPYMLFVAPVTGARRFDPKENERDNIFSMLNLKRSDIPAVTHVDYSSRIQTVSRATNQRYWELINSFKKQTGYGLLVNTSFNVRGEPIVCTPEDAYRCFMTTGMDFLVLGDFLFDKSSQPAMREND